MNLGQGITMQQVVGETVKPGEFGVDQIRDISAGFFPGRAGRLTWIDGCMENRRFGASAPMRVPLTVDSPSATRADREAVFAVIARSDLSAVAQRATASAEARRAKEEGGSDEAIHSFFTGRQWIASLTLAMTASRCATFSAVITREGG